MTTVAFVSYRLKALDGVSAEAEKWISVFEEWGCEAHRVAGFIPNPGENDHVIPELNHLDPVIESFTGRAFSGSAMSKELAPEFAGLTESIGARLSEVFADIEPDIIVAENVLSLPLNLPFTVALCRFIEEQGVACIAVHHDFFWQLDRFSSCALGEILTSYFPASLPNISHVTINKRSREELYERTGVAATCVRNCFDFDSPRQRDEFNEPLRRELGLAEAEVLFLQPTRAIERKGISRSIQFVEEFAMASGRAARLVVTGPCEEGFQDTFGGMCRGSSIEVKHVPGWLGACRNDPSASSPYDMRDAYAVSDMVTFPSSHEGFGNPVLESVVHRKLLLVAEYPVLEELRQFGFQFLSLEGMAVQRAIKLMEYPLLMQEMVDRNFEIGRKHFSLENLREELTELVALAASPMI